MYLLRPKTHKPVNTQYVSEVTWPDNTLIKYYFDKLFEVS